MSQDLWTMRKGKKKISWVWKMRNDHYGVRKKARKHGKWGMKQDLATWKFETQNLVATCTLNLRKNLEYYLKSILVILYIVLKLRKLEVKCFKWCRNRSLNEEVMAIWRQTMQSWRAISKWFWNSTYKFEIQFEITPISNSPIATLMFRLLYLENCI